MTTIRASRRRDELAMETRRMKAVQWFRAGHPPAEVARRVGVSRQAVHVWHQRFRRQGIVGLRRRARPGRPSKLPKTYWARLSRWLTRGAEAYGFPTPVWTTQRVADLIWQRFQVRYDRDHLGRLLHRLGFSWQKATGRARERDETAITHWVQRTWPRLKKRPPTERPAGVHR